jgi:large subunit ribosomal protein L28
MFGRVLTGQNNSQNNRASEAFMAKRCDICGKGPQFGRTISHAHNVAPRRFNPNLQAVRAMINGATKRLRVCTRCLRSGKVTKAA